MSCVQVNSLFVPLYLAEAPTVPVPVGPGRYRLRYATARPGSTPRLLHRRRAGGLRSIVLAKRALTQRAERAREPADGDGRDDPGSQDRWMSGGNPCATVEVVLDRDQLARDKR